MGVFFKRPSNFNWEGKRGQEQTPWIILGGEVRGWGVGSNDGRVKGLIRHTISTQPSRPGFCVTGEETEAPVSQVTFMSGGGLA